MSNQGWNPAILNQMAQQQGIGLLGLHQQASQQGLLGPETWSNQMNTINTLDLREQAQRAFEAMRAAAMYGHSFGSGGAGGSGHNRDGGFHGGGGALGDAVLVMQNKGSGLNLDLKEPEKVEKPVPKKVKAAADVDLNEYAALAEEVGYHCYELLFEKFKGWLDANDIPVFNLKEVLNYMDAKSAKEGLGGGWHWVALREQDRISRPCNFGRSSHHTGSKIIPASDYYYYGSMETYTKAIPLHALKKVALINKSPFKDNVHLMVTDYAPKPEYRPDPFLMVVFDNPDLGNGTGRYIIDVWDEPGFGLLQRLA